MLPSLILSLTLSAQAAPPPWAIERSSAPTNPAVERAWRVFSAGLTEEGLSLMKEAARADPDDIEIQRQYQITMRIAGQFASLKKEYEDRLKRSPRSARAHLLAAELEPSVERYKELVRRGAALSPDDPWLSSSAALLPLFEALAKGGDPDEAAEKLERFPSPPQNLALYRGALFNAYLTAGRFEEADQVARALKAQYPHSAQGSILLAFSAAARRDEAAALAAIAEGLAIRDAVDLRVLRGQILWGAGKHREALAEFDRAERSPKDDSCWECAMIVAYGYLGKYDRAADLAPKAFAERPWDVALRAAAASAMLRAGRLEEAGETAHSILKLRPNDVNANVTLGVAATLRGRHAEASNFLTAALKAKPGDPAIRAFRALSQFHEGKEREGFSEITNALLDAPTQPEVLEAAITVSAVFGHAETLLDRLSAIAIKEPRSPQPLVASAMLYTQRNWLDHARRDLKVAFDRVADDDGGALVKQASDMLDAQATLHREAFPKEYETHPLILAPGTVAPSSPLLYVADGALWTGEPWRAPGKRLWLDGASADPKTGVAWAPDGNSVFISSAGIVKIAIADGRVAPFVPPPARGRTVRFAPAYDGSRLARLVESTEGGVPKLEIEWIDARSGAVVERDPNPVHFPENFTTADGKWGVESHDAKFRDIELRRITLEDFRHTPLGIHGSRPSLSPNGKTLAYVHQRRTLRLYDFSSGETKTIAFGGQTASLERRIVEGPHWAPDGRHVFVSILDGNSMMAIVVDFKKKIFWAGDGLWSHVSWGPAGKK